MKNRLLVLIGVCLVISSSLAAQAPCGFDVIHQKLMATDPDYARQINATNEAIRQYIIAHPQGSNPAARIETNYTIPVVVHVMNTGGAIGTIYNPSDAQIQGAINYLNQVYAGTYPGMTAPSAGGAAGNTGIQFALAQRTPTCGATNGIDRVDASPLTNYVANGVNNANSNGVPDLTLKNFARWDPTQYYNIWVVNKIDGADGTSGQFVAGYAYFAGSPANLDGTVMLATQMTTGAKTLPHEVGHALSLYHTFQGSNNSSQCPPYTSNPTCFSDGDMCCDTDPVSNNNVGGIYDFSCRVGSNTCTSGPVKPYSINTESNFMAYTNCYTLFTNDQSARMQAAMGSPSRASLVAGSNLALVPCGTVVNFNLTSSTLAETNTGTTAGCRTYTDYTYQMVIGTGPSATATATITYSGTAVKGLDYDVTTNGNFASPSNQVTFNAGSTASQSFTVRVYDDENVESPETIILDFTLNNGGGDAAKGTTSPTLTITLNDNDQLPVGTGSGTSSQIGTTLGTLGGVPFDAKQQSMRSQLLYRASELSAAGLSAGNITAFQLFVSSKTSTRPFANFTVKMGHTALDFLINGSVNVVSGLTTVYNNASLTTAAGWNTFTFSTPFAWDGVNNIAIEICYDNITSDAANFSDGISVFQDGSTASVQGNMFYQNGINCGGSFSSVLYAQYKPIAKFGYSVIGTPIETAGGSTKSDFIAVGSNDYMYSNNNKLLLRLGTVDNSLGCTTSALDAGGTTWVSYLGGQRSAKVFAVTPTTNGSTTNYTIALYFDNSELGGKNPSTLRIAKTTAASVAASTLANTIVVTPTVTTLGSNTTVFTAPFTGFSRFFLVDPSVTLPIGLTDFTAQLTNEKNTLVSWVTSSEQNNKEFNVEMSRDGFSFISLATVASHGNSTTDQHYEWLHIKPLQGISWYRLKQTDIDGKFTYSKVVSVNIDKGQVKSFVYPVPAGDIVTVNFGTMIRKGSVEILSSDMKLLKREDINSLAAKKDISVGKLPAGVYFIRIWNGSGREMLRFIKN